MNRSKDFLVDRLNKISDSLLWPNYSVRKNLNFFKFRSKGKTQRGIDEKMKNLTEKRTGPEMIKKLGEGLKSRKRMNFLGFDETPKKHFLKNDFFSDKHIKVFRVLPSDKIVMRKVRDSREGLNIRKMKNEDSKIRMKSCVAQTEETLSYFSKKRS